MLGRGWGSIRNAPRKKKVMREKETAEASQGLRRDLCSCPFMAAPQVCSTPPRMMKGKIQLDRMGLLRSEASVLP